MPAPPPAVKLTRLDPTQTKRYPRPRTGRREIWIAASADGRWLYHRIESPGTPWEIIDTHGARRPGDPAQGRVVDELFGTLVACRRWTAGQAPSTRQVAA